ncbi:MAG: RNA-processing protein [Methanosarcinaceae archaeon]|nr:RNA-processing protein [Methanosarcinaceae archaeon]
MSQYIKIPKERIAVLIGPNGAVKKLLEEKSGAEITINSDDGSVEVREGEDPLAALRCVEVIRAVARGFNPEKAIELFYDDMLMLDIIDLSDVASTPKELLRLKGRIIGKDGKTRDIAERLINVKISVYGKTVSVLGHPEQTEIIRTAVDMLVNGVNHGTVYGFLEKKHEELMKAQANDDGYDLLYTEDDFKY